MSDGEKGAGNFLRGGSAALPAAAAAAVAVLHALKEGARQADGTLPAVPPIGDLLFDLADLHVQNMKEIAKVSQTQAEKLLEHFKQQRGTLTGRSPFPRALVSVTFPVSGAVQPARFTIWNKTTEDKKYTLPEFTEFVRVPASERNDSVFHKIGFEPNGAGANEVTVPKSGHLGLTVSVASDPRFTPGRYRACALLEASVGLPLELIIELLVEKPTLAPPAPPAPPKPAA